MVDIQGPPPRGGVTIRTLLSQISERQAEMFGVLEGAVEMTEQRLISPCTRKSEMGEQGVLVPANGRKESSPETKLV